MTENLLTRLRKYDVQYPKDIKNIDEKFANMIKKSGGNIKVAMSDYHPKEYRKVTNNFLNKNIEDINQTRKNNEYLDKILSGEVTTKDIVFEMFDEYLSAKKDEKPEIENKYSQVKELIRLEDIKINKDFKTDAFSEQTTWGIKLGKDCIGKKTYFPRTHELSNLLIYSGVFSASLGTILTLGSAAASLVDQSPELLQLSGKLLGGTIVGGMSFYAGVKLGDSKNALQADAMNLVISEASNLDNYLNRYREIKNDNTR